MFLTGGSLWVVDTTKVNLTSPSSPFADIDTICFYRHDVWVDVDKDSVYLLGDFSYI